ncbi:MAG: hypothetical protein ACREM2_08585 [Vulcanimicrobiaceae bacterium]
MFRASLVACAFGLAALLAVCRTALADQRYAVAGTDRFTVGSGALVSAITYRGTETLSVQPHGSMTRFSVLAAYERSDGTATTPGHCSFVADILPDGTVVDSADHDPDYLTVLNQPFSVSLDRRTLDDLARLDAPIPFDFPAPMAGATLHGELESVGSARLAGQRVVGVRFDAHGPLRGALPDRPATELSGTIEMQGTAYYDRSSSLLASLEATVTIVGDVIDRAQREPITIVYRRALRAVPGQALGEGAVR